MVQPLRELGEPLIDLSGPWPWLGLQSGFDALFPKGGLYYWKSRALAELTDDAIDEIVDYAERRRRRITDIVIWHHGGAMSRVGETDTAYGGRDAALPGHRRGRAGPTRRRRTRRSPGAASSGTRWTSTRPAACTSTSRASARSRRTSSAPATALNYERLAQLKAEYDPDNLFRMNLNITPAS